MGQARELSRLQFGIYLVPIDANFEGTPPEGISSANRFAV